MQQDQTQLAGGPPELPTWLVDVMWVTVVISVIWFALTVFIWMRRRASNLTSASEASVHHSATPDFMKVDHKARKEAMARGSDYDKTLQDREKAEADAAAAAAAGKGPAPKQLSMFQRVSGLCSLCFSIFSLVAAVIQVIATVDKMNTTVSQAGQLGAIAAQYPVPTGVCCFVIVFQVYNFVSGRKWSSAAAK